MTKHLTSEQRYEIYLGIKRKWSRIRIAREIGVHPSTVSRELQRNCNSNGEYVWCNAQAKVALQEKSVRQCYHVDKSMTDSVDGLYQKVDEINTHIDNLITEATDKLQVSVKVSDPDMKKVLDLFDKEHAWVFNHMRSHLKEVDDMFIAERRRVNERYKEYNGCYLGHHSQYFFWFFFVLGIVIFGLAIFFMLDSHYHWFKYMAVW